jgi:hypothetical protein
MDRLDMQPSEKVIVANADYDSTPMRIDTLRLESVVPLLVLGLIVIIGTTGTSTFGLPQFNSEVQTFDSLANHVNRMVVHTSVLWNANTFLSFEVRFTRKLDGSARKVVLSCGFALTHSFNFTNLGLVVNYTKEIEPRFRDGQATSESITLFSSRFVSHASYSGTLSLSGRVDNLDSVTLIWRSGDVGVTFYQRFLTGAFGFVVVGIVGLWIEASLCSKPRWSTEFQLSFVMAIAFGLSCVARNLPFRNFFGLLAHSVLRVFQQISSIYFVRAVRRMETQSMGKQCILYSGIMFFAACEIIVCCLAALAQFRTDQLGHEQIVQQLDFGVHVLFFIFLVFQIRRSLMVIDGSEKPRFWIYVINISLLQVIIICGRLAQGLLIHPGYAMIPEVSIISTEFVFIVLMIFAHWPRARLKLDEYQDADAGDLSHLAGGESLIDDHQ